MLGDGDSENVTISFVHSGWSELLPRQAAAIHALVALATVRDRDGSLDALVALVGMGWFDDATGGLDSPTRWLHPDDTGHPEYEADAAKAYHQCVTTFAKARLAVPAILRDLAVTMAELGILAVDPSVPRWRLTPQLLLPAEALPIADELRDAEDERRWFARHEWTAVCLARFFAAAGARQWPLVTSVERLQAAICHDADNVRAALELLVRDGALVVRDMSGSDADPERLLAQSPVVVSELDFDEPPPSVDDPPA